MLSQKNQAVDTWTLLQLSQIQVLAIYIGAKIETSQLIGSEPDISLSLNSGSQNFHCCQTASIVEGGFGAMLYVTLTMPGTSRIISLASFSRILKESGVGVATLASTLSQQRTSIC